ncbi:MAG: hypothetical protein K0B00_01220 [Rhodobacteraceae bacterium]|nr:hypothetical protein [Paracoccaceae bacterium]
MKRMIALTTAAAIALTGITASPAAALDKNGREFLGVLLGMAVLGAVISEANKGNARPQPQPQPRRAPPPSNNWGNNGWNGHGNNNWENRTTWLPATCLRSVRVNGSNREVVSAQCLRDQGLNQRLPSNCSFDVRTDWGTQKVYGTACLSNEGFKVARR